MRQLAAGVAHELRNPLGTIKASAEMLTKESTKRRPEVMSEMAGYIGSEGDRMNGLISSFLDFARPLQIRPAKASLRSVIDDVIRPQNTRWRICRSLSVLRNKNLQNPWKKHDNLPL